jgi:hypothetical protein
MLSKTAYDELVDNNSVMKDAREILHDELSSPVFFNLAEMEARLPTFSQRGMYIIF